MSEYVSKDEMFLCTCSDVPYEVIFSGIVINGEQFEEGIDFEYTEEDYIKEADL